MFIEVFKHSVMITGFVLIMMILIEYLTIQTKGKWNVAFQKNSWLQIVLASFLGLAPGCLGSFMAVTLYTHEIFNFAALVTVMIATTGDDFFVLFGMAPDTALLLLPILFVISVVTGFILNLFFRNKTFIKLPENHLKYHSHDPECTVFEPVSFIQQLKRISFQRAILLTLVAILLVFFISGDLGSHEWDWERITFIIILSIGLFVVATVPEHFLMEHLWQHTIKKHLPRIFLWTLGTFLLIHTLEHYIFPEESELHEMARNFHIIILLIAVGAGIIPESGPHIVFISLFVGGTIPFSILLANSIVQDGHGAIPLLAESRKSFLMMKAANVAVGLIIGFAGYFMGW